MSLRPTAVVPLFLALLSEPIVAQFRQVGGFGTDVVTSFAADSSGIYAACYHGRLYRSTDSGTNWNLLSEPVVNRGIYFVLTIRNRIYFGTSGSGVYRSDDHGLTATPVNSGLFLPVEVRSMASTDSNLYAGTYGNGIQRSSVRQDQWDRVVPAGLILSMAAKGSKVFAASVQGGVYRSLDDGLSWSFADSGLANRHITDVAFDGHRVYAASNGYGISDNFLKTSVTIGYEVFVSADDGKTWTIAFDNSYFQRVICFAFLGGSSGDSLIAIGTPNGVFVSTNPGRTWTNISSGLPIESIFTIAVYNSYILVGTTSGNVWRRPIAEILTSVTHPNDRPPTDFLLCQNYPNPFNSSTRIRLGSPITSFGSVKVYDLLGREVSTLLSQELRPGNYDLVFDATGLPSGIYYCRLLAGSFSQTIKLVFQK